MRPIVTALACVALLFVASANVHADDSFGQKVFNQAVALVDGQSETIQETASGVPLLCGEAAEAGVDPEVVNAAYNQFMQLGSTFMLGSQLRGEANLLAELAVTDAEYLDATKKVLLAKRALDKVTSELDGIVKTLQEATEKANAPPEA